MPHPFPSLVAALALVPPAGALAEGGGDEGSVDPAPFVLGQVLASNGPGANVVLAVDVDGDGDADLVACSEKDDLVEWFENLDGLGTMGPGQKVSTAPDRPWALATADLDGDGDRDVLSASRDDDVVGWYENTDGLGAFGPRQVISSQVGRASWVDAADLDGDVDVDVLATGDQDAQVSWFENTDGLGSFGPEQVVEGDAPGALHAAAVDVDVDGSPDVLWAASTIVSSSKTTIWDARIAWHRNVDGQGLFLAGSDVVQSMTWFGVTAVTAADLEEDGDPDVAAAWTSGSSTPKLVWYRNFGTGTYSGEKVVSSGFPAFSSLATAHLDGDGDREFLTSSNFGDDIVWYENLDGSDLFGPKTVISEDADGPRWVAAADLDGDGDTDLASAAETWDEVATYENTDGAGSFGPMTVISSGSGPAGGAKAALFVDLDSDGDEDVLASAFPWAAWFENTDGLGSFAATVRVVADGASAWVATADVDGDGDTDVLNVRSALDLVEWYANDGTGAFGTPLVVSTAGDSPSSAFAADLDGDGDADVLTTSTADDEVAWVANTDGLGTFGPAQILTTTADLADEVLAADVDGDGDLDAVYASQFDHTVAWFENTDGAGSFGPEQIVATSVGFAESVAAGDLDGDGDVDLLAGGSGEIVRFENLDGLGTFSGELTITMQISGSSLVPVDVDGDGDLDLGAVSYSYDTAAWFENTDGTGTFAGPNAFATADAPRFVRAGDPDGDGVPDLVFAAEFSAEITWYENTSCGVVLASSEVVRLGTPPNPAALLPGQTGGPAIGSTWNPLVDHTTFLPLAVTDLLAVTAAPANLPLPPFGTLLLDVSGPTYLFTTPAGVPFEVDFPANCNLIGGALHAQAASTDGAALALTNALDLVVGS